MTIDIVVVNMIVNHVQMFRKFRKTIDIFFFLYKIFIFYRGVKPLEKKDGEGAHNWGSQTENPDEHPVPE